MSLELTVRHECIPHLLLKLSCAAQRTLKSEFFIFLCGCETWTLLADSEKRILDFGDQVPEETFPHLLLGEQNHN